MACCGGEASVGVAQEGKGGGEGRLERALIRVRAEGAGSTDAVCETASM